MIKLLYPLKYPRISQPFNSNFRKSFDGKTLDWVYKKSDGSKGNHGALDLVNNAGRTLGEPVMACADGEVTVVKENYGVVVKHNFGGATYFSQYWHLLEPKVKKGDKIKVGDIVGLAGGNPKDNIPDGGITTAAHLHFAIFKGTYHSDNRVDPQGAEFSLIAYEQYFSVDIPETQDPRPEWQARALNWAKEPGLISEPEKAPFSIEQVIWIAEVLRKFYNLIKSK